MAAQGLGTYAAYMGMKGRFFWFRTNGLSKKKTRRSNNLPGPFKRNRTDSNWTIGHVITIFLKYIL
jgi:hypothetical protein